MSDVSFHRRLNLEEGRFQESFSSQSPGVNKLAVSPAHGLIAAAGEEGLLECFDARQERMVGRFDAAAATGHVRPPPPPNTHTSHHTHTYNKYIWKHTDT